MGGCGGCGSVCCRQKGSEDVRVVVACFRRFRALLFRTYLGVLFDVINIRRIFHSFVHLVQRVTRAGHAEGGTKKSIHSSAIQVTTEYISSYNRLYT